MLRHRRRSGSDVPVRLLYSSRSLDDVIYRAELDEPADGVEVVQTLTRKQPAGWTGYARRVDAALLGEVAWPAAAEPARLRLRPHELRRDRRRRPGRARLPAARVKTERFGATGRKMMEALDGNAIAGLLLDVFGAEMTTATGVCAHCGARGPVAELVVYHRAPGTVVRCRSCAGVLMVLVEVRGINCVDLRGLAMLERSLRDS